MQTERVIEEQISHERRILTRPFGVCGCGGGYVDVDVDERDTVVVRFGTVFE